MEEEANVVHFSEKNCYKKWVCIVHLLVNSRPVVLACPSLHIQLYILPSCVADANSTVFCYILCIITFTWSRARLIVFWINIYRRNLHTTHEFNPETLLSDAEKIFGLIVRSHLATKILLLIQVSQPWLTFFTFASFYFVEACFQKLGFMSKCFW